MTTTTRPKPTDLVALFAIATAAHLSGDWRLERAARHELERQHGIIVRFSHRVKKEQQR